MPQFDLFCIGDSAIDQFLRIDPLSLESSTGRFCFTHGAKIPVDSFSTSIAGNAINVSVHASFLGMKVGVYTVVGKDPNGERIKTELSARNIDVGLIDIMPGANTNVHAVISANEERTIFSYHEKRDYNVSIWPKTKWLFYSSLAKGFEVFQEKIVSHIKDNPDVGVIFNPGTLQMQAGVSRLTNVLSVTHVLFVNENEAMKLVEADIAGFSLSNEYLLDLHKKLNNLGPKVSVITLGLYGASCYDGKDFIRMKAFDDTRPVVDKTGAGDAFTGAFIAGMYHNKSLKECMKWGSINSSETIRVVGSINGTCNLNTLETLSKSIEF